MASAFIEGRALGGGSGAASSVDSPDLGSATPIGGGTTDRVGFPFWVGRAKLIEADPEQVHR